MYYYCSRDDITDLLESLTNSVIETAAQQDSKLRAPATHWIDSVYPGLAPFPGVPTNDPTGWQINSSNHSSSDSSVAIDGGSGDPAVGDIFRVVRVGQWDADSDDLVQPDMPIRPYRVTAYSGSMLSYEPDAEHDWPDNSPVWFGPPALVRQACRYYAAGLAMQLLRRNPVDEMATAFFTTARNLLQMPDGQHTAYARPDISYDVTLTGGNVEVAV